jgi:hypothetical protein
VKIKYLLLTLAFIPTAAPANDDILKSVFNGPGPSVDASLWNNHYVEQVPSNICGATTSGSIEWCEEPFHVHPPTTPSIEPCLFMADHECYSPPVDDKKK